MKWHNRSSCPLTAFKGLDERAAEAYFEELLALLNIRTFSLQRVPLSILQLKQANSHSPHDFREVAR